MYSCKAKRINYVLVETKTTVNQRAVPVEVPADSSIVIATFECDSNRNIYMKQIEHLTSANIEHEVTFTNNTLSVSTIRKPQTLHVIVKDSIVERQIPIEVPVETVVNRMKWWQTTLIWIGIVAIAALIIKVIIQKLISL
jgi:hypothetical protein